MSPDAVQGLSGPVLQVFPAPLQPPAAPPLYVVDLGNCNGKIKYSFFLVLLMLYYFSIIYSNFFLYKYLATMTENNKAIKETDKKKDRKRNFIPARASVMCAVVMVISYIVFALLYSVPVKTIQTGKERLS